MKNAFKFLMIAFAIVSMYGCSKDDDTPRQEQFVANGETFNLSNAKIYLSGETEYGNEQGEFIYRTYFITDGTLTSGSGWNLQTDYVDATYYFGIQLLVPASSEFAPGEYESRYSWGNVASSATACYFYVETTDPAEYYESENNEINPGKFTVSGGVDEGETFGISYDGKLSYWKKVEENWIETEFNGKLYFNGEVLTLPN